MKTAVTSASGQLGSAIVKQLIEEIGKDNVIAIARTPAKAEQLGVAVRKGDYNNREDFDIALKGIDAVLLVSGMDEPQKRIQQHRNVIEAAKQNGVKKIVYTSIIGDEEKNAFSPVVQSNRQTEADVRESGLQWVIGRNGIYIEPDLEYIQTYKREGEIRNCAGHGKCGYTSRPELGYAYAKMLLNDKHIGKTYNLMGETITQARLAELINQVYKTNLIYNAVPCEAYEKERKEELGEFIGSVIAGIYKGISDGVYNIPSDFEQAAGRPHKPVIELIREFKHL
ncbi:NAD(P)H dehydrogenase (quinone) [Roseivirga ehrenbergii]|uniref:NAD(P)-dependent oxidoreductase n=1 Tax=Roseivirga ehrenbergii (strain DSM 102268 / JCM 13514 / KCTC 12282 / NCIMB 14502 / KMM 6017) TaxID=279360 RepID=A0A150XEH0_ROSEK|nr:SDR family oxidoreductase [Roseivirga ehrenbergii]KYG77098.1 NAD(P)-dependent oxidoreductase [Roseivirga ehrenbergii]TCL14395.1 NAD(P)H dehydrogenase (quinone) [Roseivirga ehrenbergii]